MLKSDRLHTCAEKIQVQCPRLEHGSKRRLRERPQPSGRQIENKIEITLQRNNKKLPDWDNISPNAVEEIHGTLEERLGNVNQSKMSIEVTYGIFV